MDFHMRVKERHDQMFTEIGKAYGYNCFLITTLKPVPRGTEGAVSVEGTLAGVGGSLIIAAYGALVGLIGRDWRSVALVAAAALFAFARRRRRAKRKHNPIRDKAKQR